MSIKVINPIPSEWGIYIVPGGTLLGIPNPKSNSNQGILRFVYRTLEKHTSMVSAIEEYNKHNQCVSEEQTDISLYSPSTPEEYYQRRRNQKNLSNARARAKARGEHVPEREYNGGIPRNVRRTPQEINVYKQMIIQRREARKEIKEDMSNTLEILKELTKQESTPFSGLKRQNSEEITPQKRQATNSNDEPD